MSGQIGCQVIIPYRGDGYWARELKLAGDLGQIVNFPCELKRYDQVQGAVCLQLYLKFRLIRMTCCRSSAPKLLLICLEIGKRLFITNFMILMSRLLIGLPRFVYF
jgi:hypothetical protein